MNHRIEIRPVNSKAELNTFVYLPESIHRNDKNWLPPVYSDEFDWFNKKKNKGLARCETLMLLAYLNDRPVGRVMGIIDPQFNEQHEERSARFYQLECIDDGEVLSRLMASVEEWARGKGMDAVYGPFGLSDKDPQGLQTEGFEYLSVIATATNGAYLPGLLTDQGFSKKFDCVVYRMNVPDPIPDLYLRIYDRARMNTGFQLVEFQKKSQLKPYIIPVLKSVNEIYRSIFGFVELDEEEMRQLAKKYLPILDPAFTKVVIDPTGRPIAFIVASPDMSKGIIRARGRLFPFGFIHILNSAKHTDQLDFFLGGVRSEYRNTGITALLGVSLFRSAAARGMKYIDTHLILEDNKAMRSIIERWDSVIYKRYRVFQKSIR